MDRLLQEVLQGDFPVGSAVQWINGDNTLSPPAHILRPKLQTAWQTEGPTPEGFKAFILNYVRDQAEFILSAAEKKGPTRRGGTPQPSGSNTVGRVAPVSRTKRTEAEHLRQLESVARRLDPGTVDETNFPSLGAGSTSTTNSTKASAKHGTQKPFSAAEVGMAPKQMKRIVATPVAGGDGNYGAGGKGTSSSGNTPRRRIQPTQVAEVEVSKQFVTAQLSEPGLSGDAFPKKMTVPMPTNTTAAASSKLASRLGALGLDNDNDENPFLSTNSRSRAREITPQKEASTLENDSKLRELSTPPSNKLNFEENLVPRSATSTAAAELAPAPVSASSPAVAAAGAAASSQARSAPKLLPLSASGHTLAALHAGILTTAADISLTTEVNLILNLLAVPLTAEVDSSLVACPELDVLLTCGVQSQQYAALVLEHAGGLLKGLGLHLLEEIATAAAATTTALDEFSTDFLQIPQNTKNSMAPSPIEVMKMFKETASAAENVLRSRQLRTEKAFNRVTTAGSRNSIAGGVGLHAFTADGVRSRSIEDQRRVSNREACRDAFFALMRDTSSRAAFFGRNISQKGDGGGAQNNQNNITGGVPNGGGGGSVSVSLSLVFGADGRSHSGEPDGVVFGRIQVASSNLLRTLRPDNFLAFAELLTAAILQAAATGDALLDEELTKLAKRDGVSRFHSLNRRMQGGEGGGGGGGGGASGGGGNTGSGAVGPRRANPMALRRLNSSGSTSIGFGSTSNSTSSTSGATGSIKKQPPTSPFKQNNSNANNAHKMQRGGVGGNCGNHSTTRYTNDHSNYTSQLPGGAQAMDEAAACAARVMSEFPHALRLYILFLEAADSHRLNAALMRVMTEKLKSLATPQATMAAAPGQSLGEKVVAASALAGILGYLAFAKNSANAKPVPWEEKEEKEERENSKKGRKYDGSHPIDVAGAVHASIGTSHVLRTLPWVTRYLHFLKWDSEAVESPYFTSLLSTLGDLKCAAELLPGGYGFGPAALCLRSLLDDFSATVLPLNPTNSERNARTAKTVFGNALTSSDQLIDLRYVDLCCPVLAHARRLFAPEGGVIVRSEPRRILPTAPLATTAAVGPPLLQSKSSEIEQASLLVSPPSSPGTLKDKSGAVLKEKQQKLTAVTGAGPPSSVLLPTKKSPTFSSSITGDRTTTLIPRTTIDPVKVRLQQTFLQQYSQEDRLVKLKDVVDYCSDVIGCNAATATVAKLAPEAVKTASDDVVTLVTEYAEAHSITAASSIEQQQIELEQFSNAVAEKATAATIKQVLNAAFGAAQEPIKVASLRAVLGLVSPELGDAVIATAAAMVAETAEEACNGRLPALVRKAIRQDDLAGHAKSAVKAIIKERRKFLQQNNSEPACSRP